MASLSVTEVTEALADRPHSAFLAQGAPAVTQWGCSAQAATVAKVVQTVALSPASGGIGGHGGILLGPNGTDGQPGPHA